MAFGEEDDGGVEEGDFVVGVGVVDESGDGDEDLRGGRKVGSL